jgi:hypothetical protein
MVAAVANPSAIQSDVVTFPSPIGKKHPRTRPPVRNFFVPSASINLERAKIAGAVL